jgi:hypothetical protein
LVFVFFYFCFCFVFCFHKLREEECKQFSALSIASVLVF